MGHIQFLARDNLVQSTNVVSGVAFNQVCVSPYTRLSGIGIVTGSLTIRIQTQLTETGSSYVSSSWVCNSGTNFLDTPNRGNFITVDCTASTSGQPAATIQIVGEPLR